MKDLVKKMYKAAFSADGDQQKKAVPSAVFVKDEKSGINKREYASYQAYLDHQSAKLTKNLSQIQQYDLEYEQIVKNRYQNAFDFSGKNTLCLAARLGGEVRAFKSLGSLAIGIDLEPGENNKHVLFGDFHNLQFPEHSFDFAFTNAIDHVFELERFLREVQRVLNPSGVFIVEFAEVRPGQYEVLDTEDINPILAIIKNSFNVVENQSITNSTEYGTWSGRLLHLKPL